MAFFSLSALRTILTTETDADSPGSEELLSQIRENFEALMMLYGDTGVSGTVVSCVTDTLTDTANFAGNDVHNGHTLLITSGTAIGNTYTIDDTTVNTLVCTGDDLAADGVAASDTYKVFFDLLVNTDGHDHDGVNSAEVVLADDQVTQAKIDDAAVGQAQLKTTTGEVNTGNIATGLNADIVVPGGEYAFYPQIKGLATETGIAVTFADNVSTSYVNRMWFNNTSGGDATLYCQSRYVQASGPLFWLYLLRDKQTGENRGEWFAPDHCCFGYSQTPEDMPHPFSRFDPKLHNLIIIHPTNEQVREARKVKQKNKDLSIIDIFFELFEIDTSKEEKWPSDVDISVDLEEDFNTGRQVVVKVKIEKPKDCKYYKLKEK